MRRAGGGPAGPRGAPHAGNLHRPRRLCCLWGPGKQEGEADGPRRRDGRGATSQDRKRGDLGRPKSFRDLPITRTLPIEEQKREEFEDKPFPLRGK